MRLLEWAAESPAVTTCAYKRVTGRTVELGLAQVKAGCKTPVRKKGGFTREADAVTIPRYSIRAFRHEPYDQE